MLATHAAHLDAAAEEAAVAESVPVLEEYTDLVELGAGGFGTVYRAWHEELQREVAIKVLNRTWEGEQAAARFQREGTALGRLSGHPNIIGVHDMVTAADGRTCLVMPHLRGGSMGDRIAASGAQPWPDAVAVGIEVAGALQTAHDEGSRLAEEPPPHVSDAGVPPDIADVLTAAMAKDPQERPPTPASLARLLQAGQRAAGVAVTPLPYLPGGEARRPTTSR